MTPRKLGKTGLDVSPICIGAWQLAGPLFFDGKPDGHPDPGKQGVIHMIRTLGDMGINFIDTAEQYGNGESERRVGQALEGQRDKWIMSTKFGYRVGPDGEREDDSSPRTIRQSIEGSLKRLRTDYIDVYLYHCPPNPDHLEAGKAVLDALVAEGKCRFYGISTNNTALVNRMIGLQMVDVLQYSANLLQPSDALRDLAHEHNIGTQIRGTMAQGRLSGKYFHAKPTWQHDDNRSTRLHTDDLSRYSIFEQAIPAGYAMSQVAIRWALDLPGNHSVCLGAKTLDDYKTAIKALDLPALTTATHQELAACAQQL